MTVSEVSELLGIGRQAPHDRLKTASLLAVKDRGQWRFPVWQFDPDGPDGILDGLPETLRALRGPISDLGKVRWFVTPKDALDRRRNPAWGSTCRSGRRCGPSSAGTGCFVGAAGPPAPTPQQGAAGGGDLANGRDAPMGQSAMTRREQPHPFTALRRPSQASAWARDALLGGATVTTALLLAFAWSLGGPGRRRRSPPVAAPAWARERRWL